MPLLTAKTYKLSRRLESYFEIIHGKNLRRQNLLAVRIEELESIIQSYCDNLDFCTGRHLQNDKQNRVIFAIHHHLLSKKVGPQWQRLLSLLAAVGALKVTGGGWQNPDRRINPRIKVFEREHPVESKIIPLWVRDWPNTSIPDPRF